MLLNIFTFIGVMSLFIFVGASIYASFFNHRNDSQPIYYGKRKLSFDRQSKGMNN